MDVRERRELMVMLAPFVVGPVLVLAPAAVTLALSLTEYDLIGPARWVGLGNFRELVEDEVFRIALVNSLVFAAIAVPLRVLARAGSASPPSRGCRIGANGHHASDDRPRGRMGLIWLGSLIRCTGRSTFSFARGDNGLTIFGRLPPQWLTDPNDARAAIVLMSLFTIGEGVVLLLVARQSTP